MITISQPKPKLHILVSDIFWAISGAHDRKCGISNDPTGLVMPSAYNHIYSEMEDFNRETNTCWQWIWKIENGGSLDFNFTLLPHFFFCCCRRQQYWCVLSWQFWAKFSFFCILSWHQLPTSVLFVQKDYKIHHSEIRSCNLKGPHKLKLQWQTIWTLPTDKNSHSLTILSNAQIK